MIKHGKSKLIRFTDSDLRRLRNAFNSLDDDGSGAIGVDELEDPLIALGLVDTRQQVKELVEMVDEDASELIEFEEFLQIIKGGKATDEGSSQSKEQGQMFKMYKFFKDFTDGTLLSFFNKFKGKLVDKRNPNEPFSLFVSR